MTLKEAFRYKNFMTKLTAELNLAVARGDNLFTTTKTHLRRAANPDAEDMTELVVNQNPVDITAAIKLYDRLVMETDKLTAAIETAKHAMPNCLDAMIQSNIRRKNMADAIKGILQAKASETQGTATGHKFNAEGNQTPYVYQTVTTKTENFNRADLKTKYQQLRTTSDETSAAIDSLMVNTVVDYTAPWNVNHTLADILESDEFTAN